MDDKHFLSGKTIVIAGAGVSGSAFVAAFQQQWDPTFPPPTFPPPTLIIYDRDAPDIAAQREGYSVSLAGYDSTGGLMALKKMGLLDKVLCSAISGLDGKGSFKIWGPDWSEYLDLRREPAPGIPTSSIRVARATLRNILHDAIDRVTIQWESICTSVRNLPDGRLVVQVLQGGKAQVHEQECDLVVVADGASSKLRACLRPRDKLEYSGAVLRGALSRFDGPLPKPLHQDWGFMLSNTGVSCFFSPVDEHSVVWAVGNLEHTQVSKLDISSVEQVDAILERSHELGKPFHGSFRSIVAHSDRSTVMCLNAEDKLPFAHSGDEPIIFIGDSNHALSPFAGFGANLALCDGWDLAEQLCKRRTLGEALKAYDATRMPRAERVVRTSRRNLKQAHATGWRLRMFVWVLTVVMFVRRVMRFFGW